MLNINKVKWFAVSMETCPECYGSGYVPGLGTLEICPKCGGTGEVEDY